MRWYERASVIVAERRRAGTGTAEELAEKIGCTPGTISKVLRGKLGQDSIEWAYKIAAALEIDPAELLLGENYQRPIRKLTAKLFINKPSDYERYKDQSSISSTDYAPIKLLKDPVAAGHPLEIKEWDVDGWTLIYRSKEWMPHDPEFYTCARVSGYSMYPILAPGDIVAIDHLQREPSALVDKMVAFREDGGVTIKWLRIFESHKLVIGEPENRDERNSTIMLPADEAYDHIVGKVAWWWAKR